MSSGTAITAAEAVALETLPEGFAVDWAGQSREEKKAAGDTPKLLAFAFVSAFLCLAALYESWRLPFAVLLGVPVGIFGALFSEWTLGALSAFLGRANPGIAMRKFSAPTLETRKKEKPRICGFSFLHDSIYGNEADEIFLSAVRIIAAPRPCLRKS